MILNIREDIALYPGPGHNFVSGLHTLKPKKPKKNF